MTFERPLAIVAAVLAALAFLALVRWSSRRRRAATIAFSDLAFLEAAAGRSPWGAVLTAIWALAIVAAGLALAHPSIVADVAVHDAAVVLCVDTSGSMASTDVAPTRSDAARGAVQTFADGTPPGTRLAIVAFSSTAIPLGPLSADRATIADEIARIPAPNGGTAIGDALAAAAALLPPAGRRAIVLVTDGVNNQGRDPLEAASAIGASGIAIFTVGIGTNGSGELIPGTGESAEIDEDALRTIADDGHGTYARVADADALRERLASLANATVHERRHVDLRFPTALAAVVLALLATTLGVALGRIE